MSPSKRSVWAPACPMHCFSNFGEMDDDEAKDWAVPAKSENTLGETSHWFIFQNLTGAFIDQVNWPNNVPCNNITSTASKCGGPQTYKNDKA